MSKEFNRQANFYDSKYESNQVGLFGFPDLKIVDLKRDIHGQKILSVGGGTGADIKFLATTNEVYLLDGSIRAVEQARLHNIMAEVADVEAKLNFVDDSFDIVVLKDVLEHVYDPFNLLLEARRVLKDHGRIILSLPNHFYLPFRLRILFGGNLIWKSLLHDHKRDFEEWNYMHIRFFTWHGVKKMLKLASLKVDRAFWDFGTLAHYSDPEMYEYAFKLNNKKVTNKRQWLMYKVLFPAYKIFNFVLPKKLRGFIVGICPGLLCAGFYLKLKKI